MRKRRRAHTAATGGLPEVLPRNSNTSKLGKTEEEKKEEKERGESEEL